MTCTWANSVTMTHSHCQAEMSSPCPEHNPLFRNCKIEGPTFYFSLCVAAGQTFHTHFNCSYSTFTTS